MQIVEITNNCNQVITAYNPGSIWVSGQEYTQSIIIQNDKLTVCPLKHIQEINPAYIKEILQLKNQLLIIGSGPKFLPLDSTLISYLNHNKVGVEVMDTYAACRTYTVLVAEQRNFSAIFFLN